MRCPFCSFEESKVTDSRNAPESNAVRRRRECLQCLRRFTTFETVDLTIQVKKRDGTYEDFQQEKLIKGLESACRHTRISHDQVRSLAYKISADLLETQVREIPTITLGEIVMKQLRDLDMIAYIRFACVYRRFKDVDELMDALYPNNMKNWEFDKEAPQNFGAKTNLSYSLGIDPNNLKSWEFDKEAPKNSSLEQANSAYKQALSEEKNSGTQHKIEALTTGPADDTQ